MAEKKKDTKVEVKETKKPSREAPAGKKWITVNKSELSGYEKEGKLSGYDPKTKEALVRV